MNIRSCMYIHNGPQAFLYPLERPGNDARYPRAWSHIKGREEDGAYTNFCDIFLPSWQQECQDQVSQYMASSLTTEDIHVPKEVAAQAVSIAVKLQKQNPGLIVVPNSDGTIITVAGQTSSVNLAKEAIDSLCSTITDSALVLLSLQYFDYFQQVKKSDLPSGIACTFDDTTFTVFLRGPIGAVTKLKDSIGDFLQHVDSPVMLGPLVTEFFRTKSGRDKLEKFLQERQCHAAVHFSQFPTLTLHLLCDRTNANHVKAVVSQIHLHVTSHAIPIPEAVVLIIANLEDFIQLCQTVEHEHGVLIKLYYNYSMDKKSNGCSHGISPP